MQLEKRVNIERDFSNDNEATFSEHAVISAIMHDWNNECTLRLSPPKWGLFAH